MKSFVKFNLGVMRSPSIGAAVRADQLPIFPLIQESK